MPCRAHHNLCINLKTQTMLKEFRDFIMKGNVLELAVAVIIAGAFGAIVTCLRSLGNMVIIQKLFDDNLNKAIYFFISVSE